MISNFNIRNDVNLRENIQLTNTASYGKNTYLLLAASHWSNLICADDGAECIYDQLLTIAFLKTDT